MMLILRKIIELCKFIFSLVLEEEKFVFEMRPEFCFSKTPASSIHTSLKYQHQEVKNLIHKFKYNKNKDALKICSKFLAQNILDTSKIIDLSNSLLITIPRSNKRLKKFGFDQCHLLAIEILKDKNIQRLNIQYENKILIHKKEFDSQTKANRKERILNSKNSFYIKNPQNITGQKIILIDDVWTTSATLLDAKRAISKCFPKEIHCFTIAH